MVKTMGFGTESRILDGKSIICDLFEALLLAHYMVDTDIV